MNRAGAVVVLAATAASLAAVFALPAWAAAALGAAAFVLAGPARRGLAWLALSNLAFGALLLALVTPTGQTVAVGPLRAGSDGALLGLAAGARLSALAAVAAAWLRAAPAPRLVAALRLPPRAAGTLGALLLAAHGVREDWEHLVLARRAEGSWPRGWRRLKAAAQLVPSLVAASLRRAHVRRDALRLAGVDTGPLFVPVVAFGALAVAGRLLFLAIPNVALTYLVTFLAGLLAGPAVGVAVGALAMGLTDLLLTGLLPAPFVNVPAMALLGALGGWLRGAGWGRRGRLDRAADRALAAAVGAAATLLFSATADVLGWLLVPEFRGTPGALAALLAAGLAFNVLPAAANAVLFALAVPAAARAWSDLHPPPQAGTSGQP